MKSSSLRAPVLFVPALLAAVCSPAAFSCVGDDPNSSSAADAAAADKDAQSADGSLREDAASGKDGATQQDPPAPLNETSWALHVPTRFATNVPVAVAADGYSVVTSAYFGSVAGFPTSGELSAVAIVLLDPAGKPVWKKGAVAGGPGTLDVHAVAFDERGDIYVGGVTGVATTFGGAAQLDAATSAGHDYAFVAKLRRSDGDGIWAQAFGSPAASSISALSVRGNDVAISGTFNDTLAVEKADLTTQNLAAGAGIPTFVAKLDGETGLARWATVGSAVVGDNGFFNVVAGVGLDAAGHVYLGGSYRGTLSTLGPTPLVSVGEQPNGYLFSLDGSTGTARWGRSFGSTSASTGLYVKGYAQNDSVIAIGGQVPSGTDFGDAKPVGTTGTSDAFFAAFDLASGEPRWHAVFGGADEGPDGEGINAVAIDAWDQIVGVGEYRQIFPIGDTTLVVPPMIPSDPPTPATCLFGAKYTASGTPVWAKSIPATVLMRGRGAAATTAGSFVVSAAFQGEGVALGAGVTGTTEPTSVDLAVMGWTP